MTTWESMKKDLYINQKDKNDIELEKDLIRTKTAIHKEKGLTQTNQQNLYLKK